MARLVFAVHAPSHPPGAESHRENRLLTHRLTEQLCVSAQVTVEDIPALAARGFRSIVSNRPDGEEPGQPANAALAAAARAAGLHWASVPISGPPSPAQVRAFADALAASPAPTLAFCRTGNRSCMLWALQAGGTADSIIGTAAKAGYDLSGLRPMLGHAPAG